MGWSVHQNIDMCGQGDVEIIWNWRSKHSIEDLKRIVEQKGYSAISVGSFDHAALKKFPCQLTADHCEPSPGYSNTLYIWGGRGGGGGSADGSEVAPKEPGEGSGGSLRKVEVGRVMSWYDYRARAKQEGGRLPTTAELRAAGVDVGYDQWTPITPSPGDQETGRRDGARGKDENAWANIGPRKYQIEYPAWGLDASEHPWKRLTYFYVVSASGGSGRRFSFANLFGWAGGGSGAAPVASLDAWVGQKCESFPNGQPDHIVETFQFTREGEIYVTTGTASGRNTYTRHGETLQHQHHAEVTATLRPNGELAWSHGYGSRIQGGGGW